VRGRWRERERWEERSSGDGVRNSMWSSSLQRRIKEGEGGGDEGSSSFTTQSVEVSYPGPRIGAPASPAAASARLALPLPGFRRLLALALQCCPLEPEKRPSMENVAGVLEALLGRCA